MITIVIFYIFINLLQISYTEHTVDHFSIQALWIIYYLLESHEFPFISGLY